jgi:two-component system chemotaxis sensor kinase CheA
MPLVPVEGGGARRERGPQPTLVFSDAERSLGLLVDEIVDIVEGRLDIEVPSGEPGRLGSAVLQGRAMEIVDAGHYVALAFGERLEPERADRRGRRLLLVDDSPFFRNMLAPVLKAAGHEVATCASAEDALDTLKAGGFDVIVSDIEMPGMSGFELAEAVRAEGRATPLIALSSRAPAPVVERGRRAGFRDFVAKFDRQGLIAALKNTAVDLEEAA